MLAVMIATAVALASPTPQDSAHYVKQTSPGSVTLDVWPEWRDTALVVHVRATTHTVDLGTVDLCEQLRLFVAGTEMAPLRAGRLSGHHAAGDVVFRLDERPSSFTITIRDVPDVPVRTITWPPVPAKPHDRLDHR